MFFFTVVPVRVTVPFPFVLELVTLYFILETVYTLPFTTFFFAAAFFAASAAAFCAASAAVFCAASAAAFWASSFSRAVILPSASVSFFSRSAGMSDLCASESPLKATWLRRQLLCLPALSYPQTLIQGSHSKQHRMLFF